MDDGACTARAVVDELPRTARLAVEELASSSRRLLGHAVESIILHGSLTLHDFDPERSDIDLLVVVTEPPDPQARQAVVDAVTRIARLHRLRVDYRVVTTSVARNPASIPWLELYVGVHSEGPEGIEVNASVSEPDLVIEFSMCRQHGRALQGLAPADTIGHVPADRVLSVGDSYLERWQAIGDDPDAADLTALTACRLWYFAIRERHVSKAKAAEWVATRAEGAPAEAARHALARHEGRSSAALDPANVMELLDAARSVIAAR